MLFFNKALLSATLVSNFYAVAQVKAAHLPIVYLGYEIHQAISLDELTDSYNFSNIRFAAPPVGNLRFSAPAPPAVDRAAVQTGSEARICPQAIPWWMEQSMSDAVVYVTNGSVTSLGSILVDPRASEGCLFLDVVVPRRIFKTAGEKRKGAPVIVWIYGGGYAAGSKTGQDSGSPADLLRRGDNSFVYVAINYRLGAFGWLSGPALQLSGSANAGFLDQHFTLEWIQKNIHMFCSQAPKATAMMAGSAPLSLVLKDPQLFTGGAFALGNLTENIMIC